MDKFTVARMLDEIARYLELSDANPFKARAFEKAARAVEGMTEEVSAAVASDSLLKVPGIGKGTGEVIAEIVDSGSSRYLEELRAQYPPGIFDLLRVPRLGLKKIGVLYEKLGISSIDQLEAAAETGELAALKGFGPKTSEQILQGIAFARMRESQFLLPIGIEAGELMRERLETLDEVEAAEVTGSVRRRLEVIRNVNIVVATKKPQLVATALEALAADLDEVAKGTWRGIVRGEVPVYFHLVPPKEFGTAVFRTTGSTAFLAAFEEKAGAIAASATEREVFTRAGISPVAPERREDGEELRRKKRTKLLEPNDLRGVFHVHTTWSDGRNSVAEMLAAARERGWEYLGISDHSKNAHYAGGLTEERLAMQQAELRKEAKKVSPMRVFRGSEADILQDGSIDYGARTLAKFDFVVASVHSHFKMERDEMTERILRAMDDPHVTFIGHLTGRLLLSREGYTVDYDRIFEKAGERGVMIEINGNPRRLDVDWRHLRRAVDRGVVLSIHPDAHSIREYDATITGTWVARKAGLGAKQIFNTRSLDEVEEYFEERKALRR